jgi:hypothetical protein
MSGNGFARRRGVCVGVGVHTVVHPQKVRHCVGVYPR